MQMYVNMYIKYANVFDRLSCNNNSTIHYWFLASVVLFSGLQLSVILKWLCIFAPIVNEKYFCQFISCV